MLSKSRCFFYKYMQKYSIWVSSMTQLCHPGNVSDSKSGYPCLFWELKKISIPWIIFTHIPTSFLQETMKIWGSKFVPLFDQICYSFLSEVCFFLPFHGVSKSFLRLCRGCEENAPPFLWIQEPSSIPEKQPFSPKPCIPVCLQTSTNMITDDSCNLVLVFDKAKMCNPTLVGHRWPLYSSVLISCQIQQLMHVIDDSSVLLQ